MTLRRLWRRLLRRERRLRFIRLFPLWLALCGLPVVGWVLLVWWQGGSRPEALGEGWLLAGLLALLLGGLLAREGRRQRSGWLVRWDGESQARGALLSAMHLEAGEVSGRLAPLVVLDAARLAEASPLPTRGTLPAPAASLALLALTGSSLLCLLPLSSRGAGSFSQGSNPVRQAGRKPGAGAKDKKPFQKKNAAPLPRNLEDFLELAIAPDHRAYLLGEEITVTARLAVKALHAPGLKLVVRLGVANGLPYPDHGLGEGFHLLGFPGPIPLPEKVGLSATRSVHLLGPLRRWNIYVPGLYTLEARAIVLGAGSRQLGAVVSNRVTIQVSENRRHLSYRQPHPVQQQRRPRSPRPRRKPRQKPPGKKGRAALKEGPPERLAGVRRHPEAVKPLLSKGPTVKKEVAVFDRERGGKEPPLPPALPPVREPRRSFMRRPEHPQPRLKVSPGAWQLIRRYFQSLQQDG